MTQRARVSLPTVAGQLALAPVTEAPVVAGVGVTVSSPVLAEVPGVTGGTETESPPGLGRPD